MLHPQKVLWHLSSDFNYTPNDKHNINLMVYEKFALPSSMVEATTELDAGPVPCLL